MTDAVDFNQPALRWRRGGLQAIQAVQQVRLHDLLGIETQKARLVTNTAQFVAGAPANHALLTGARGTGKSSLVKALLTQFADDGLRLVEVAPTDLVELPEIVAPLRDAPFRFVLYVDDFSLGATDDTLTALKAALDGSVEAPPDNVLLYATSNRRHLLPEPKSDNLDAHNLDGEIHPGEAVEEKISLSDRFGLWLSFYPFNQAGYLDIVRAHLRRLGSEELTDEARTAALQWALGRGSRSGRTAHQFARHWVGSRQI
ncbi:ATP-binding protein [Abyssibacter profundi]|uniref:AAA family ATPase n=1 Tax=Abyssibacter profundi TaxID=2182787 RepID=A0A363UJY3_9GAMM|nr:ATP-binding protein [Abyssibacter profundi]PWN55736.1 AAA family ATPase [Abyssibacter profundi]